MSTIYNEIGDLTKEECETFMKIVDSDGNGLIGLDEFLQRHEQSKQAMDKYAEIVVKENVKNKQDGLQLEGEGWADSPSSSP